MLTVIAIALVAAVAAVLAIAARRPDRFTIERSARIDAPADAIAAHVEDFRAWTSWSPWEGMDPAMQRTYSGAERGVGAAYAWEGSRKVGAGRMAITAVDPGRAVDLDLEFLRPMKARNTTRFSFAPEGTGTRVTWTMQGPQPFVSRLFGLVFNLDKMVGADFEKGLAALKALAERRQIS